MYARGVDRRGRFEQARRESVLIGKGGGSFVIAILLSDVPGWNEASESLDRYIYKE